MYSIGFIVGKFMPLHKGHEFLINTALGMCDRVVVLTYGDNENYPKELRKTWLETVCPGVEVIAPYHFPKDNAPVDHHRHYTAHMFNRHIMGFPLEQDTTYALFSSEEYGEPLSEQMSIELCRRVTNVVVDIDRVAVPISGTKLRENPDPAYLSPFVRNKRVLIVGGESSGKTTVTRLLGEHFNFIREYGRDWWEDSTKTMTDLMHIAENQTQMENAYCIGNMAFDDNVLICDTGPLTTSFYAKKLFGRVPPRLAQLAERGYDHIYLLKRHFAFEQDGTRFGESFSDEGFEFYKQFFDARYIEYTTLDSGSAEQKADLIKQDLE